MREKRDRLRGEILPSIALLLSAPVLCRALPLSHSHADPHTQLHHHPLGNLTSLSCCSSLVNPNPFLGRIRNRFTNPWKQKHQTDINRYVAVFDVFCKIAFQTCGFSMSETYVCVCLSCDIDVRIEIMCECVCVLAGCRRPRPAAPSLRSPSLLLLSHSHVSVSALRDDFILYRKWQLPFSQKKVLKTPNGS